LLSRCIEASRGLALVAEAQGVEGGPKALTTGAN
jgi:hypothetical protein